MSADALAALKPRGKQVRPQLAEAIRLIVERGFTQLAAAEAVGLKGPSLSVALKKPHVQAFKADVKRAWLNSETERSWRTVVELRDGAGSEKVRLEAAKTILQASGELKPEDEGGGNGAPTIIIQQAQTITNGARQLEQRTPGVWRAPDPVLIEGQAVEVEE